MSGKVQTLEDAFRRYFPDVDPGNRRDVVAAYAAVSLSIGSMYQRIRRETGADKSYGSQMQKQAILARLGTHKDFSVYMTAIQKRHSAVRLIGSWEKIGTRKLLEEEGIDVARFRSDEASAARDLTKKNLQAGSDNPGAGPNVVNLPDDRKPPVGTKEATSHRSAAKSGQVQSAQPDRPVRPDEASLPEWYHAGAVIELSGGRRIAVVQAWSESKAVVVALGEGKEVPVNWTRLPSPSDRMALSLNPLVPNDVTAGDFGFSEAVAEPTVQSGAVVQPIDVIERDSPVERRGGPDAGIEETGALLRGGSLGSPGEPLDAGRFASRPSPRPFTRLGGTSLSIGLMVLSVGTFSFLGNEVVPEGVRSASLAVGSVVAGRNRTETDDARVSAGYPAGGGDMVGRTGVVAGTMPEVRVTAEDVARRGDESRAGAEKKGLDKGARVQAVAGTTHPETARKDEGRRRAATNASKTPAFAGAVTGGLAPGMCVPASVKVVIGGQKVMATTAGCVREDGVINLDAGSRRADADLRNYQVALDAAERRIKKSGLTREQARMLRDGAESDPRKEAMLESRAGVAEAVDILDAPRGTARGSIVR